MSELIWKQQADNIMTAEASYYCCCPLYGIAPVEGGFDLCFTYAAPSDPIRDRTVFASVDAAKAAAEAAFTRLEQTKFWDVIAEADLYLEDRRKRHHEPGCNYAGESVH
jgi:hypothetical protein